MGKQRFSWSRALCVARLFPIKAQNPTEIVKRLQERFGTTVHRIHDLRIEPGESVTDFRQRAKKYLTELLDIKTAEQIQLGLIEGTIDEQSLT